jgi:hypothetical protein
MLYIYYKSNLSSSTPSIGKNYDKFFQYFEVHVYEPNKDQYPSCFSKNFYYWKRNIDIYSPYRIGSVIYKCKKSKRNILKYIFDDQYSAQQFIKILIKEYYDLKIIFKRFIHYY